mgnify:CR=1 FL=1
MRTHEHDDETRTPWREWLAPRPVDWTALERRILEAAAPRLVARRARTPESAWEILARWAWPGLAAAATATLVALAATRTSTGPAAPTLDEALRPNGDPLAAVVFARSEPPGDAVARVFFEPAR